LSFYLPVISLYSLVLSYKITWVFTTENSLQVTKTERNDHSIFCIFYYCRKSYFPSFMKKKNLIFCFVVVIYHKRKWHLIRKFNIT
jgi:hypothetical protein